MKKYTSMLADVSLCWIGTLVLLVEFNGCFLDHYATLSVFCCFVDVVQKELEKGYVHYIKLKEKEF